LSCRKKKKKEEKKLLEQVTNATEVPVEIKKPAELKRTKAELAFLKQQEKMVRLFFLCCYLDK